jgi:hypothetical protein
MVSWSPTVGIMVGVRVMEFLVIDVLIGMCNHVKWNLIAHLLSKEDL